MLQTSNRLKIWIIPSRMTRSTQYDDSTIVWRNLPFYHLSWYFVLLFERNVRDVCFTSDWKIELSTYFVLYQKKKGNKVPELFIRGYAGDFNNWHKRRPRLSALYVIAKPIFERLVLVSGRQSSAKIVIMPSRPHTHRSHCSCFSIPPLYLQILVFLRFPHLV